MDGGGVVILRTAQAKRENGNPSMGSGWVLEPGLHQYGLLPRAWR